MSSSKSLVVSDLEKFGTGVTFKLGPFIKEGYAKLIQVLCGSYGILKKKLTLLDGLEKGLFNLVSA